MLLRQLRPSAEIDVLSFSESILNAGTYDAGTGGNTGKAAYSDINITKYMDKSSPTLRQYCGLGTSINTATLSCNKQAGDKKVEYFKVTLHNVVITSIQASGSGGSTDRSSRFGGTPGRPVSLDVVAEDRRPVAPG